MATKVDELIVEIKAETKSLRKGLDGVNKKLNTANAQAKKSVTSFASLGKVFATIGLAKLGGQIVSTSRTFQDLEATLRAITGSGESAAMSMDLIRKFTMGTTFQLENVSQAFITMLNAGITPTSETMKDFGNIAAAFGKDITQIAQAAFNATTGEMEMLKQFGIKAKQEGDKITMIFREQETVIGKNSTEIVGFLRKIAQENFATALEERLNTVSGVFSNLGDMVAETFTSIGEGGLNEVLTTTGKSILEMADDFKKAGHVIGVLFKGAFDVLGSAVKLVVDNMRVLLLVLGTYAAFKAPVVATLLFTKAIQGLNKGMIALRATMLAVSRSPFFAVITAGILGAELLLPELLDELIEKIKSFAEALGEKLGLTEAMKDLLEEFKTTEKTTEELDAEMVALAEQMAKNAKAAENLAVTFGDELKQAVISTSNSFTNDFVNALMDGQNALNSFRDFAKNMVSQIISIFLQMAVVNRILNAVFQLSGNSRLPEITSFPSFGGGGGGGINPVNPFNPNVQSPTGAPMTFGAGGGSVQPRRPMVVGERGAEIFVPNVGGRLMNNADSRGVGGGGLVVNQQISFSTGVVPTVRAEVSKMLPQIADVTKFAVLEAAQRGGSFRKGLQGA